MCYPAITSRGYWRQVGRYGMEPGLLWAIRITSFSFTNPIIARAGGGVKTAQRWAARPLPANSMKERYFLPLLLRLEWPRSQTATASRVMPPFATPVMNSTVSAAGDSANRYPAPSRNSRVASSAVRLLPS
jgi:hypothetical protein